MKRFPAPGLFLLLLLVSFPIPAGDAASPMPAEWARRQTRAETGGAATTERTNESAFATPVRGLAARQRRKFAIGDHLFNTNWTTPPGSVKTKDGLGPLYNRVSCASCHIRDGRGRPPVEGEAFLLSELVRLSVPGTDEHGGPKPHPVYGGQFQEFGVLGVPKEGRTRITWEEIEGAYEDGTPYRLRRPSYELTELGYGPLGEDVMISARVASAVFGAGLLEAIPEEQILANADPEDADGDGVSGRPNRVWDVKAERPALGRFGWKANQPSLDQQAAAAFSNDIGITTPLFPEPSLTEHQTEAVEAARLGDQPEVDGETLNEVTEYIRMLAVPARRDMDDTKVRAGEKIFYRAGCATCHQPTFTTGPHSIRQLSEQTIHPYTDLLLHDLGEGLADGRPDYGATGREWRTQPLWGLGMQETVNGHTFLLHDGRARNVEEAILWHGGEAEASREFFRKLPKADRVALVAFLNSL